MNSLQEHYRILDASPTASLKEIRLIYRDLAQVWHPDRFEENPRLREKAEAKLKAINHAYESIRKSHQSSPPRKNAPPKEKPARTARPDTNVVSTEEANALGWYAKAAAEGHADAQCIIATMYAEGQRVPRDDAKAIYWYHKSAEQGHPAAEFQMGLRYYSGGGVQKDPRKAFNYYRRAALQGHAKAQFNLGIMYTNGVHILRDEISAYAWFTIAAAGGHPDAKSQRRSIDDTLTEAELKRAINQTTRLRAQITVG
ncbi:MAG: TPR repeat protein [Verrucomicrobiales bacterium]|jgi:TPR repeat protein